jgi:hypothetical protein
VGNRPWHPETPRTLGLTWRSPRLKTCLCDDRLTSAHNQTVILLLVSVIVTVGSCKAFVGRSQKDK